VLTVLVLMGGPGSEREVSFASGAEVVKALKAGGHHVLESDIGPDQLDALDHPEIEVVFPALHGPFGEGGQLQKILEERNIPFVGSDSAASALAMDKYRSKERFTQVGLATPPAVLYYNEQDKDSLEMVGLPAVIKPNCEGSSVGVLFADDRQQLFDAVEQSLGVYGHALVERKIIGRELTVGILADQALPVMEIRPAQGFYDYEAKYELDSTEYLFDLGLTEERIVRIQDQARLAFESLGCRDFGRVDFMLDAEETAHLLEVNTIPGLTTHSLLPKAAGRVGINMIEMCDQIVRIAADRPI
jgi:D-alanine-D-alanine ligase